MCTTCQKGWSFKFCVYIKYNSLYYVRLLINETNIYPISFETSLPSLSVGVGETIVEEEEGG